MAYSPKRDRLNQLSAKSLVENFPNFCRRPSRVPRNSLTSRCVRGTDAGQANGSQAENFREERHDENENENELPPLNPKNREKNLKSRMKRRKRGELHW
jgi:hypothetical protein